MIRAVLRALDRVGGPYGASRTRTALVLALIAWAFLTFVGLVLWMDRVMWGPW